MPHRIAQWLALLALSTLNPQLTTVFAQGTAFNYQGRLNRGTNLANGIFDFRFTVYDSTNSPGVIIAGPVTGSDTRVSNGLFSVTLDFGAGVFTGPSRWLQLEVRTNGAISFARLLPRQSILPMPYAVMANTASNLLGTLPAAQVSGTLPVTQLPNSVVTNGTTGVTLTGTLSGNGAGLTNLSAGSFAPGFGVVPSGGIILSTTATNASLTSAGFALMTNPVGGVWTLATNAAPWSGRSSFGAVAFNGQMWVMGGCALDASGTTNTCFNDVWSSSNGVTWTRATSAAPWSGRGSFGAVVFNGKMWVLGGCTRYGYDVTNDVWSSSNGVTWTRATNAAPWRARYSFGAVVFNGKMWVIGGRPDDDATNDVWSSSNGVTWTRATNAAPWSARSDLGAVVFNGKMWVMGGIMFLPECNVGYPHDVWSSSDGANWTQVSGAAPWRYGYGSDAVALNGQICIFDRNDAYGYVWSSSNGVTWTQATSPVPWGGRYGFRTVALNGQMWVLGGDNGFTFFNDVWLLQNAATLGGFYLFQKQ